MQPEYGVRKIFGLPASLRFLAAPKGLRQLEDPAAKPERQQDRPTYQQNQDQVLFGELPFSITPKLHSPSSFPIGEGFRHLPLILRLNEP